MSKVTGKYQITLPKAIATACRIRVGDDLHLQAVGDAVLIRRAGAETERPKVSERLAHFDGTTRRLAARRRPKRKTQAQQRGWTRDELYTRGRAR